MRSSLAIIFALVSMSAHAEELRQDQPAAAPVIQVLMKVPSAARMTPRPGYTIPVASNCRYYCQSEETTCRAGCIGHHNEYACKADCRAEESQCTSQCD